MRKIFFIFILFGVVYAKNSCPDYKERLKRCNALPTQYQRQMCRLGLFASCK
ncbi:hypothetical protein ACRCD5_01440 [Campylobacter taeniopygiae]|uniref:hypothetical protein n=1 Tax=Campylobacter taeniopygiae TaxID=2510188 RepID=UPI003D6C2E48